MKNILKNKVAIFLLFIGISTKVRLHAQAACTYPIANSLLCNVDLTYTIYDAACSVVLGPITTSISASGSINVGAGLCATLYDVEIIITQINGIPINTLPNTPQTSPVLGGCPTVNTSDGGNCSTACDVAATGSWTITWTAAGATIQ